MLTAVVEQMEPRLKFLFSKTARLVAAFPHHHGHSQLSRNQEWLIAEIRCTPAGIHDVHATRLPSIAARKDVE